MLGRSGQAATLSRLAVIVALVACGDGATGPPAPPPVNSVVVTGRTQLRLGETSQLSARTLDAAGNELTGRTVSWGSNATSVATVSPAGLVTTTGLGQARVTATAEGKAGSVTVDVRPVPVGRIAVTPSIDSLFVGDSLQLAVQVYDSANCVVTDRAVAWAVSDAAKGRVSSSGLAFAIQAAGFAVTATAEGVTGGAFLAGQYRVAGVILPDTVHLRVTQLARLIALVRAADGTLLGGRRTTWTSLDPSVVVVDTGGVLQPQSPGTGRVSATVAGLADTVIVTIAPAAVAGLPITALDDVRLAVGREVRFDVSPIDVSGTPIPAVQVAWTSADTAIAGIRPDSLVANRAIVSGRGPGVTTIAATADGLRNEIPVTIDLPIVRLQAHPDSMQLPVGLRQPINPVLMDSAGNVLVSLAAVPWTVSDTAIAEVETVSLPNLVVGKAPGRAMLTTQLTYPLSWRVGADTLFADTVVVTVPAPGGARLELGFSHAALTNYSPTAIAVSLTDSDGSPLPGGSAVRLVSSDTSIAVLGDTILPSLSGTTVVALDVRGPGTAVVKASSDSLYDFAQIIVADIPAFDVTISPKLAILDAADSIPLTATVRGTDGGTRPYPVTWTTSTPSAAVVTAAGWLVGVGGGRATIRAASLGKEDSFTVTVRTGGGPIISGASPAPVRAGTSATVAGSGFDPDPSRNVVVIDGVPATVVAATTTGLDLMVPAPGAYPCRATRLATLSVAVGAEVAAIAVPFAAAPRHTLGAGQAVVLDASSAACNEIDITGGTYALAVVNGASPPAATMSFQLRAEAATAALASAAPSALRGSPPATRAAHAAGRLPTIRSLPAHLRVLEGSHRFAELTGSPVPELRTMIRPLLSIADSVNSLVRIRVPRVDRPDFCASSVAITARRVYSGERAVVYEDVAAPLARQMDGYYLALLQEFDQAMYPNLLANFGDPLALDSLTDRNGRIVMLFSPVVNALGVGGFVVSCDFFPEPVAPSSNTGEIFYGIVPTSPGSGYDALTIDYWRWVIRAFVMHEAKHLAMLAERLSRGLPLEAAWLEEGSAVVAEEIWMRGITGTTWKGNATYAQTLRCEVRPTDPACSGRPFSLYEPFARLHDYLFGEAGNQSIERHSPLGPTAPGDGTFSGSAWSLLRWAVDQYATNEAAFLRALTTSPATGVANLEARTGRSVGALVADWSLALLTDDMAGFVPVDARHRIPSWHTRGVFAGMHQDFPQLFPEEYPLVPWPLAWGDYTYPVITVPGGSFALLRTYGAQGVRQVFELRGADGEPVPPLLRLAILRLN